MPYAEGQDLSVPYAECSQLEQIFRDTEAMRAWRELTLLVASGDGHANDYPPCDSDVCPWVGPSFAGLDQCPNPLSPPCNTASWYWAETSTSDVSVCNVDPADAILLAARELEGTDEKQG